MADERTDSIGHSLSQATENRTPQTPPSPIEATQLRIEDSEFLGAAHQTTTQQTPSSQIPATIELRSAEVSQNKSTLLSDEGQPQFDPFIFVNQQDLQSFGSSQLRKAIRSHVRRGTHLKQQRLNAASRPNLTGVKKILKRPEFETGVVSVNRASKALPLRQQQIKVHPAVIRDPNSLAPFSRVPVNDRWQDQDVETGPSSSFTSGPPAFQPSFTAPSTVTLNYPPQTISHLYVSHYQLDSSE
jgi:hypothetical protein